jgi:hypothetical protein
LIDDLRRRNDLWYLRLHRVAEVLKPGASTKEIQDLIGDAVRDAGDACDAPCSTWCWPVGEDLMEYLGRVVREVAQSGSVGGCVGRP